MSEPAATTPAETTPAATTTTPAATTDTKIDLTSLESLGLTGGMLSALTGTSTSMCDEGDAECKKLEEAAKLALENAK